MTWAEVLAEKKDKEEASKNGLKLLQMISIIYRPKEEK